uniref:7TM_GPCR_Srx domain-containing protein n=1 Tax=Steinernema glaseri TaxID=37863 RepID=A0A1I7YPF3_9BILA
MAELAVISLEKDSAEPHASVMENSEDQMVSEIVGIRDRHWHSRHLRDRFWRKRAEVVLQTAMHPPRLADHPWHPPEPNDDAGHRRGSVLQHPFPHPVPENGRFHERFPLTLSFSLLQETISFGMARFLVCCCYSLLGTSLPYFGLLTPGPIPVCSIGLAALSWFTSYWVFFSSVLTIFIFVLYIAIYFIFSRRGTTSIGNTAAQRTIAVTITAILISYFFLYCIPNLSILVVNITGVTPLWVSVTSLVTGLGSGLNATGNVFIYGWKHSELRLAMRGVPLVRHLIFCNEKTVTVATATPLSMARINTKMYG